MQQRELQIEPRGQTGKGVSRRLRRAGKVPAILYGATHPLPITVDPRDVLRLIHGHEGSTQLLSLKVGGDSSARLAIIRDMQFDPVSERLVHVDLQEVAMDRPITVTVAVHAVGEPAGVRSSKGC
jgi:large subunit ribosomal protein L25